MLRREVRAILENGVVESDMIKPIDINRLSEDDYRLSVALDLKRVHKQMVDNKSITTILKALIEDDVEFTKLELSAMEKLLLICAHSDKAYYGTKPAGYDMAVNHTLMNSLITNIKKETSGVKLEKCKLKDITTVPYDTEVVNCLAYTGLMTYYDILNLTRVLFINISVRG